MGITTRCRYVGVAPILNLLMEKLDSLMIKFDNLDTAVKGLDLQIRTTLPKAIELIAAKDKEIERLNGLLSQQGQVDEAGQAVMDNMARVLETMTEGLKNFEEKL